MADFKPFKVYEVKDGVLTEFTVVDCNAVEPGCSETWKCLRWVNHKLERFRTSVRNHYAATPLRAWKVEQLRIALEQKDLEKQISKLIEQRKELAGYACVIDTEITKLESIPA